MSEAIEAATAALIAFDGTQVPSDATVEDEARAIATVAVAAAEPVIRAQIAAEIEAHRDADPATCQADRDYDTGLTMAADIARGQP